MLRMTLSATALSRIVLVGEPPGRAPLPTGKDRPAIRRYRLARVRLDGRAEGRFAHLRRSYD
jgi:hypothetical protein